MFPKEFELIIMQHQVDRAFKEFYKLVEEGKDTLFAKKICCPLYQALRDARYPVVIIAGDNPKLKHEIVASMEGATYQIDEAGHEIINEWDEICSDFGDFMEMELYPSVVKLTKIEEN